MTTTLIVSSTIVSVFTLMSIGGNDVANSQGTAVGSGALSIRGAQILAAICEFAGAALVGSAVSNTIGSKMVSGTDISPMQYCWGMFSGLLSVGVWMIIATAIKMPVSATHSIIGALFGLNLVITSWDWSSPDWPVLGKIAIAWIVTPLLSFVASFLFLSLLNIYWPPDGERDQLIDEESPSPPPSIDANRTRSSLLSFVMAPPAARLTPIATPTPKPLGDSQKVRLTWAAANTKNQDKVKEEKEEEQIIDDAPNEFEPQRFKFALFFGILMATLVIFIMIGGPKSINIEDGHIQVEDWVIVVIAFGSLFVFVIVGYLIEGCYRQCYIGCFYSTKGKGDGYQAVELAETKAEVKVTGMKQRQTVDVVTVTPPGSDDDADHDNDKTRKSMHEPNTPSSHGKYAKIDDLDKKKDDEEKEDALDVSFNNQDYFRLYLVVASGAVAFAHGGNDVANVLGPFGQIYKYATTGSIEGEQDIPIYVAGGAGLCIAAGFALFGTPVLETIGKSITKLSYRSGFAAQFCAAATVLVCNVLGIPVSSSTVIVGGVSGVGYYNSKQRRKKLNKNKTTTEEEEVEYIGCVNKIKYLWSQDNIRVLCKILLIWIITIPANAILSGGCYALINLFL